MNRTNNLELVFTVYQIVGYLTSLLVYAAGALGFMVSGQSAMLIGWLALLGPPVAGIAGLLWPFYWLAMLSQWGTL
jgi:hypothetical protein